ncbi:MFS allantoate transporter [Acephala macrosclerotiorum]|nr:MFS allantoate transporter [Acephala macrosclerotiorum]
MSDEKAVPSTDVISSVERRETNEFPDAEKHADIAYDLFEQSHQYDPAQLEKDSIKVRRKLDFIVLPMMMMTYMLSFLDKQTLNYSNAYGLQADTHMTGDDYSWVSSALYFGWLIGAYPWNVALQRFPIGRLMGCMLFAWGAVCMLQAAVFNFSGFFAIRLFLGTLEACISPAWVLLTSMLWTREEQPLRTSYWLSVNGVSSVIGALLSYGLGHVDGLAVPNWKLIYLVVGAITFAWGFVIILYLPDGPHNAKMLTEYERIVAVWRVSKNRTGVKDPQIHSYQIKEALLDVKTWLLLITGACFGILNGGVANFSSALIEGFGFTPLKTSLMQAPGGAIELVFVILFGYLATVKNMLGATIITSCLPGIAGLVGILKINIEHRYALVAMAWLQSILGSPIVLSWTLPGLNVAGHTKRATVLGLFFVFYCAGNIAGPHLFFPEEAPRYKSAIKGLLVCYCVAAVVQVVYTTLCWIDNRRRDAKGLLAEEEAEVAGFNDLTDKENKYFRYSI